MSITEYTTLTWEEFLSAAEEFLKISHELGDNWELLRKNNEPGYAYLVLKQKIPFKYNSQQLSTIDDIALEETAQLPEVAITSSSLEKTEMLTVEYHILYSISYQVPMLYLQANKCDGSLLQLEEAWQLFEMDHTPAQTLNREQLLGILTPMEHPILHRPFYALHPCRTPMLLQQAGTSKNAILTFLSLMGPFVKLQLSNAYGKSF